MAQTILVVDDDVDFQSQLRLLLERDGYTVRTVDSARAARESLAEARPDLVLVDVMLESPDAGFTLCYQIKKQDPTIPVLILTGVAHETQIQFDAETDEERAWIKADGLLAKPVRFEQLQGELRRLLKG
jgi:CheY-like chemotaxis protein